MPNDPSLIILLAEEVATKTAYLTDALFSLEHAVISKESVSPLMQAAHALKGAFRAVSCDALARMMHECENAIAKLPESHNFEPIYWILNRISVLQNANEENFQRLVDSITSQKEMHNDAQVVSLPISMAKYKYLLRLGLLVRAKKHSVDVATEEMLLHELYEIALRPLQSIVPHIKRLVRDVAHSEGKEVTLELSGENIRCDAILVQKLIPISAHLITNAICHGIENKEERLRKGKNTTGTLRCAFYEHDDLLQVVVSDDGRGISMELLQQRAAELGVLLPHNPLNLIFQENFSTKNEVNLNAGRGDGLGICKRFCEELGGRFEIASHVGNGTTCTLTLPKMLLMQKLCIVRKGDFRFGIPVHQCKSIMKKEEVPETKRVLGFKHYINTNDQYMPVDEVCGIEEVVLYDAKAVLDAHATEASTISHLGIDSTGAIVFLPSSLYYNSQIGK